MQSPAGWHIQADGRERYWDGTQWTDQFREVAAGLASPNPSPNRTASKKHLIGYGATALLALGIGGAIGGGGDTQQLASADSKAGPTVTKTVAGPGGATVTTTATVSVPGPTKTVVSPKPAKTVTVRVTPPPKAAISEGVWEVGVDVKPGSYKVIDPVDSGNCYWKITRRGTSDIVDNDIVTGGRPVVTLRSGQEFTSQRCGDWSRVG